MFCIQFWFHKFNTNANIRGSLIYSIKEKKFGIRLNFLIKDKEDIIKYISMNNLGGVKWLLEGNHV